MTKITSWIKDNGVFSGINGAFLAAFVAIIISLIPNKKEDNQCVSIGGNVVASADSAITDSGNINIAKEVSKTSDRIVSIQKRLLRNLDTQNPLINFLIQKAKDVFYDNKLDEAEKIIKDIDLKQGEKP